MKTIGFESNFLSDLECISEDENIKTAEISSALLSEPPTEFWKAY